MIHSVTRSDGRPARLVIAVGAALTALAIIAAPVGAVTGWNKPIAVFNTRFGPAHATAVDSTGHVLIASEGGAYDGLWLTSNQPDGGGPGWFNLQLTTAADMHPSIAVYNNRFYVAFERRDPNTLVSKGIWMVTNRTGTVVTTKVDGHEDYNPSIAVHNGHAYIAYEDATTHRLVYLANVSGSWTRQTVDTTCCAGGIAIAVTSGGQPRIAYSDGSPGASTRLAYASRSSGGTWSIKTVDSHPSDVPSLVLDSGNQPRIAYLRLSHGAWYAHASGAGFALTFLRNVLEAPSIAVDGAGHVFVALGNNRRLFYDTNVSGSFVTTQLTFPAADQEDYAPDLVRYAGKARIVFNRDFGGTTADGIYFMRQQ